MHQTLILKNVKKFKKLAKDLTLHATISYFNRYYHIIREHINVRHAVLIHYSFN